MQNLDTLKDLFTQPSKQKSQKPSFNKILRNSSVFFKNNNKKFKLHSQSAKEHDREPNKNTGVIGIKKI